MSALVTWVKSRKTLASVVVIAIIAGVPLTIAALHPGFPVSDVELTSRDVWVTNGEQLLGGRLNRQIDELNGSVVASSPTFDVLQDGDTLFMVTADAGRVESVNPASTEVTSAIDVPEGAQVSYGGSVLAILAPDGKLWTIPAVGDLQFDYISAPPKLELGEGAHAVVTQDGEVIAVSPKNKKLYRIPTLVAEPEEKAFPSVGEFQLAAVGDQAVVFDQSTNEMVTENGSKYGIGDEQGIRLQQTGPDSRYAIIATADSLVRMDIGSGAAEIIPSGGESGKATPKTVAAPVNQDGCAHGAWADLQLYLLSCEGQKAEPQAIEQPTKGSALEFRVNRTVIALNNLDNGDVWLMSENMRLVDNWDDVVPPVEEESEEVGEEKSAIQTFEDALAERTDTNRPPTAQDDKFGVRPGRTTIFSVLDNDSDPDGDVLVITAWDAIAETTGRLDPIDDGRALQFTPAKGFVGTIAFNYTVDDGREGTASANVQARVVPEGVNDAPYSVREPGVSVEANQTVTYNVLTDWRDPDGDDLYLVGASPKSGDLVRFTPDGFVTFTHQTSELGEKEVVFTVSDGSDVTSEGTLTVKVEPAGSLNPVGTPDFDRAFVGETVVVKPLDNDLKPSGAALSLVGLEEPGGDASATFNTDRSTVTFTSSSPGIFYMKYTLQSGANTSVGIIRIDVSERPDDTDLPPVAVKDTAYLRGQESVTVSVLSNDASPIGRILAIQSVDVPSDFITKGLTVEVLEATLIRVTSTAALTEQLNFTYTISDGISTATAGVTVVPVPALTKHQPPIAEDDPATVRVGDIITLDVLDNDIHPDDAAMFLDENLVTEPKAGIAFVAKDMLRFQAPDVPGEYTVDYRVLDAFGESASATAIFTVTPLDDDNNHDPAPNPLIGRVLAGGNIRIDLPLSGIDPDGDSTQLLRFPQGPTLGSIAETGNDYFIYEASPAAAGTDEFTYQVYDALGATGTASIKIAVIPKPDELHDPSAVPDSVSIRPGRVAQVDLTLNDSDPQGAPIKVSPDLIDVPDGIKAEVEKKHFLVITAPDTEQSFTLRYELTNDLGGSSVTYVLVQVTPDAPLLPPSADDVPIQTKDIAGEKSIDVNLFDGYAFNPAGHTEDLVVTVEGPNADAAEVLDSPGHVQVTPGPTRQAIAYRVTNEKDDLSAMAFILVPAAVDESFDDPPYIDPDLPPQYVSMNGEREWKLSDIVIVPSGRDPHIYDKSSISAVQGDGSSILVDDGTIRFAPAANYRGPASINFTVSDGDSKDDPKGVTADLTFNVMIGDPDFKDTPPQFTTPNAQVEVGETTIIDLRASTAHPNPAILQQVTYSDIVPSSAELGTSLNGSQLSLTVPRNTKKGTQYTVGVTLRWDSFTVQGTVNVTAVGSTRPLPVAVTDDYETKRPVGTYTMDPLVNDANPYQTTGEPLRLIDAHITNAGNVGSVSVSGDQIRMTPVSTPQYLVIEIVYTLGDATEDPERQVTGIVNFTITDVPMQVAKPAREGGSQYGGDGTATIRFDAPGTNGKDITGYEVRTKQTNAVSTACTAGAPCTIGGLTNGTPYTFDVRAINVNGAGPWSAVSDSITPFGTPVAPSPVTLTASDPWGPGGTIEASWAAVAGTGGTTTYTWTASNGATGTTTGLGTGSISAEAGTHTVSVFARNEAYAGPAGTSNAVNVVQQAVPPQVGRPSTNVTDGVADGSIRWDWSGVSPNPGGAANLRYDVRVNGGGVINVGTDTTYSRGGLGAGNYSLEVRAVNKAGAGPWSQASPNGNIDNPPDPPKASLCRVPGGGTEPGSDMFGIRWSGQSGGNHTMRVGSAGNSFTYVHNESGSSGQIITQSWAFSNGTANSNARYWPIFDGNAYPDQRMGDIPSC